MLERPLEYALVEFKGNEFSGKIVPELLDLAERGIVRFVDIVFIQKEKDGSVRTVELNDLDPKSYKMFVPMGKHVPVSLPPMIWRSRRANSARTRRRPCSCGKTCGRTISARRSPIRAASWSSASKFPPKSSSRSTSGSLRKNARPQRRRSARLRREETQGRGGEEEVALEIQSRQFTGGK